RGARLIQNSERARELRRREGHLDRRSGAFCVRRRSDCVAERTPETQLEIIDNGRLTQASGDLAFPGGHRLTWQPVSCAQHLLDRQASSTANQLAEELNRRI